MNFIGIFGIDPEWIWAGGTLVGFLLLAILFSIGSRRFLKKLLKTKTSLDEVFAEAIRGLVVWALILGGAYAAVLHVSAVLQDTIFWPFVGQCFTIAWILLAIRTAIKVLNAISHWKIEQAHHGGKKDVRDVATRVGFFRRVVAAVVFVVGAIYILSVAGVNISPILAGGALGGLVVGIALQDTLSNVFAGFFLNVDRPVKIGDFIKIEAGQEGFVEDVGWRYTKVRLWANNLLIIPNNKLSQSVITNFSLPDSPMSVYVDCGVSYESDLEHVEAVAVRVAQHVQETTDGGDPSWQPIVRFNDFADSAITFTTSLRSKSINSRLKIHHEFIKALHVAFRNEQIEIPSPMRTVVIKDSSPSDPTPKQMRSESQRDAGLRG